MRANSGLITRQTPFKSKLVLVVKRDFPAPVGISNNADFSAEGEDIFSDWVETLVPNKASLFLKTLAFIV